MTERRQAMDIALALPGTYEDTPFHDPNWVVARRMGSGKIFVCTFERQGRIWLNLKVRAGWAEVLCASYESVVPAYHMNKRHWVSIVLDGSMKKREVLPLLKNCYDLTAPQLRRAKNP